MMATIQEMAKKPAAFAGGHRMCAGCPVPIITKMFTRVTDYEIIVISATGCLEVASSIFPFTAWKVPWLHTAFENAAATASGVEAMYRSLKKQGKTDKKIKFIAIGGDGGTYDIGIQSLSGAMERGHDLLYICYDNGAYMNTGIQRSGATPFGASTTTSPAGKVIPGKQQPRKDLTSIMAAHHLPYVAQSSIHSPTDLSDKLRQAIECDGPAFLNVLSPCIPGWRIDADMAVEAARLGVETRFWPLYEIKQGHYKINYKPKTNLPIADWLMTQGRFKHLKSPANQPLIEEIQRQIDQQWNWLLSQEQISN
ncbi:MAG: pyruvate ferredoxin oxidoreductase [Candidatus Delongbacteria bacterium]|nr:pyruvate ferredoxin oxidoreductase [Candidatus Delongbacteria bacterium]